jgi:tetratricopeptide (TPR) repeat protein
MSHSYPREVYKGAVADFGRALELGASPTNVHFLRSRAHTLAGDAAAAKADLDEGMRRKPADEQGWVARGLARLPGDTAGAIADFDEALKLNPRSKPARQNKAYVLFELLNKLPESIAVLDGVLKDYPTYLPSLGGRGVLLARLGKRAEALADAAACEKLSRRAETLYQVAGIYALTSRAVADDRRQAYRLLADALSERGYGLDLIDRDGDLDPIREQEEFNRVVAAAKLLRRFVDRK